MDTSPRPDSPLTQVIRDGVSEARITASSQPCWTRLRELGTELWLDTGDLEAAAELWSAEFTALTTNNTLLNAEIQKGLYDAWIPEAAEAARAEEPGLEGQDLVLEVAFALNARHGLRLVQRFGADVSVELHTDLAEDTERSVAYGLRYHALCPEHFIVKVPLTAAGLVAARRLAETGVRVNFTLGFSARENALIAHVARPAWANVFMGRLNAWVAGEGLGDGAWVGERATLASQALLRRLRAQGLPTRQIGASMRSGEQVSTLAGLDVYTMPVNVAQEFLAGNPAPESLQDRTGEDYRPQFAAGVDPRAEGLEDLWQTPEAFLEVCAGLGERDPASLSAEEILESLHGAGFGAVLPRLGEAEHAALRAGGKLPERARWREAVTRGEAGLDALFTLAGLHAFSQDQEALDRRIANALAEAGLRS